MEPVFFDILPQISKVGICGVPVRVDTYKNCTFKCAYCFANNRCKIIGGNDGADFQVGDASKLGAYFERLENKDTKTTLDTLVKQGCTMHVGGMSDPFQPRNVQYKATNKLIDVTNRFKRHLLFSTKSNDVHGANIRPDLHAFQLSVTNVMNRRDIEPNVPDIQSRINFFKSLKRGGVQSRHTHTAVHSGCSIARYSKGFRGGGPLRHGGPKSGPNEPRRDGLCVWLFENGP